MRCVLNLRKKKNLLEWLHKLENKSGRGDVLQEANSRDGSQKQPPYLPQLGLTKLWCRGGPLQFSGHRPACGRLPLLPEPGGPLPKLRQKQTKKTPTNFCFHLSLCLMA